MNIEENNKLIAEFMEIEMFGEGKDHTEALLICSALDLSVNPCTHFENVLDTVYLDDMKFDKSWDWLMPVVEKIESLPGGKWYIHIQGNTVSIEDGNETSLWDYHINHEDPIMALFPQKPDNKPIESVYQAIVEFIKWYNENKNI